MNRSRRRPRSGKTILELMIVIAASSMLLSLAAGLFHNISRTERAFRDTVVAGRAQMRLARDFRADARGAESARLIENDENPGIEFASGKETIIYTPMPDGVRRELKREETPQRDEYRLGNIKMTFTLDDSLATLTAMPKRLPPPARPRSVGEFRLIAAIGADRGLNNRLTSNANGAPTPVVAPRSSEMAP